MALQHDNHGRVNSPPVVLIHGFPFHRQVWHRQLDLSGQLRLILPDLPGFGKTPLEVAPDEATIEYYADSVADLLKELEIERAAVVGHSMGGYVALALAERNPEVVEALALVASHPFADDEAARANRRNQIERVQEEGPQVVPAGMREKLFAPETVRDRGPLVDGMYAMMKMATSEALVAGLTAMAARPDRSHVLTSTDARIMLIGGREDRVLSLDRLEEVAESIPRADFHVFEHSGHMPMLEETDRFNELLDTFVRMPEREKPVGVD